MTDKKTKIKFHGKGWKIPTDWELNVSSLGEAMRAIEINTKSFYKELQEKDKKGVRYHLVINGNGFKSDKPLETISDIKSSELALSYNKLDTIDIIPVIEGADSDFLTVIAGVILIIVGVVLLIAGGSGIPLIGAGIGLLAAGVSNLLSKPPNFEDFREIDEGGKTSYLFSGPQNIIGEGGPVPICYGTLVVGSQVISAAYIIRDFNTEDTSTYVRDEYGNITNLDLPLIDLTWRGDLAPYN